ncbi:MAG: 4,5-DOPA dioxygenase extradiol [Rhodoferax sp.]|uniref:4,5-DOPA-extradiol-dioxygenase n=1 Tax=Rhodoferax sp. TaxID=50421 RepID=UPI003265D4CB
MTRRHFFHTAMALIAAHPLAQAAGPLATGPARGRMPVLFIGHGSPMNALRNTPFTRHLGALGRELPRPRAILVVSAHWAAEQPLLSAVARPETIYDFGGFPTALYGVRYPSPGQPALAQQVARQLKAAGGGLDMQRGLDHGAWTVLHHMYPQADIPVIQLAMSTRLRMDEHVALGTELRALREEGVLVLASGNIVHNLRLTDETPGVQAYDWALEFDSLVKTALLQRDMPSLLAQDARKHSLWHKAHPSIEHYVPLLYALGAANENDAISFPYTGFEEASLSMRSVRFG